MEIVDCALSESRDAAAACVPRKYLKDRFAWHLENAKRLDEPLDVVHLPYGVWFYPWKRRNSEK